MYKLKVLVKWPLIQAHLCTLAIAFSYNSTWFIPRDSFRYGALTYGLLLSVAMLLLALPVMLLQLAVGQLSQQDAVAVWRAIPFFKGVGYLRLLISFVVSLYSIIDMAMSGVLSFYTISNSIPFSECKHNVSNEDQEMEVIYNATTCFRLYYPVKSMKRIFYVLGPTLLVLCIVIICNIGNRSGYNKFIVPTDWSHFLRPNIWHSAIAQAFLSTQIAGGYLISAGDAVYSKVDVVTTFIIGATNIFSTWFCLIFWYSLADSQNDSDPFAMIVHTYNLTVERELNIVSLLFPLYDRLRRFHVRKWQFISVGVSVVGATLSLVVLAFHLSLVTLQDFIVPFLKIRSSFRPSRHWGPRDPITHYYWRARRDEAEHNAPRTRYYRRKLGQFSGTSSFGSVSRIEDVKAIRDVKTRSNSDDWLYSYRKNYLTEMFNIHYAIKRRSKSLDWAILTASSQKKGYEVHKNTDSSNTTPTHSMIVVEENVLVEAVKK
ncbi:unnamed protein product [Leptidea sinapis]|uniref:Uncharacterized protein n=1 Tax=Leptidea sinapis TaxID=189913 RepID=A0A5E4PZJ0_9NEOP|nr:unnamed protein product [Leptidea sinapis]